MAKGGGKSSASSGTRKKHAKRAAGPSDEPLPKDKKPKKKEKGQKKEPQQKIYIPPVKPAPLQPDPLETTGLARTLPAELLVVLRSFGKKAQVTKIRALEELQSAWVDKCLKEGEDGELMYTLANMLPVWLHHVSALFIHPSRRVRALTAGLQTSFLQIPIVRDQIFFFIRETATSRQIESILGTWCMATHDIDRSVAASALKSWKHAISGGLTLDEHVVVPLVAFCQRTALDPNGVYLYLNPVPPIITTQPSKRTPGKQQPDPDQGGRPKADEHEENEEDRKARLRVGAFGAIRWILETINPSPSDDSTTFFSNPAFWTSLCPIKLCPFADIESFGFAQPIVRKSAWALVQTLSKVWKGHLEPLLPILSAATLRSAWVELDTTVHSVMWQPLLMFLKEFPKAWELERVHESNIDESEDSDSEDEAEPSEKTERLTAYQEFLRFLELGCSGSPVQGYPTVVIILSTIPSSILTSPASSPPFSDLFTSFWAAIDGRALSSLHRSATSAAFLSAVLESMTFLIKRLRSDSRHQEASESATPDVQDEAKKLAQEQFGRVWEELINKKLRVEERAAARLLARTLDSLNEIDEGLFKAAWDTLAHAMEAASETNASLVAILLKVFYDHFKDGTSTKEHASSLMSNVLQSSVDGLENALSTPSDSEALSSKDVTLLISMINNFREGLFHNDDFSHHIDVMAARHAYQLLGLSPHLLLGYMAYRKNEEQCLRLWHGIIAGVAEHPNDIHNSMAPLLGAAEKGQLPRYLRPAANELDILVENSLSVALDEPLGSSQLSFVHQIIQVPEYFLSEHGFSKLLQNVMSVFVYNVDLGLRDSAVALSRFEAPLDLITSFFQHPPTLSTEKDALDSLLPDIVVLGYLYPEFYQVDHPTFQSAKTICTQWLESSLTGSTAEVLSQIKSKLKSLLCDTQVRPLPEHILRSLIEASLGSVVNLLGDIFPSSSEIDLMLEILPSDAIDPSLAVGDLLVPPASGFMQKHAESQLFDSCGFSAYARIINALLQVFIANRQTSKSNAWALRHLLAFSLYAQDFQSIPSTENSVFNSKALAAGLTDIISKAQQVVTYVLTSRSEDGWSLVALTAVAEDKPVESLDTLPRFLAELIKYSRDHDTVRESRILRLVLEHVLDDVDKNEADLWMNLARKVERIAPQTSMAIVSAVTEFAPEPPRLDRYRNELAAALLGVSAKKADTEGLLILRKLAITAPDPDSDVVFLPQVRAVNVVKAFQQWIASDEDMDEEVESVMTLVLSHLAPILQSVPGAHWDLTFDIVESNLENSSIPDDTTLVTLARTLRLIIMIQNLCLTNNSLRADWQDRKLPILTMVRDLATTRLDSVNISVPRSICRELVLSIVQDLPASLIDQDTLPKMCHLIMDPSAEVQKMAYQLLQGAAKKRTEFLVIEAGVDAEATAKADLLPSELLDMLQQNFSLAGDTSELEEQYVFGCLLGWMLLFDLFKDASLKVRLIYIDQLRGLGIIAAHFMPSLISLLRLDEGIAKAFKLDVWAVNEYFIQYYETGFSFNTSVLAAHLYYRALLTVPSLIHTWVLDCKDRQLSSSIFTYTSQHLSPVLIHTELARINDPEATSDLVDDNMTIKVVTSTNEVMASYLVDEHHLEIKLKIPADWPLHKIEVKDVKRVGVDENRWRAWMLAVQQNIWSHNGSIVDGLGLFKKNVTLHFEGQVECPICYSIISVMDGNSLPKKACKTCKNKFHAGCLYKWFDSSHSSTCPLCRSDIM